MCPVHLTASTDMPQLLMREYGVAEDHIFSSRDLSFVKGILRMTNQRGVDVIVNSLSGEVIVPHRIPAH